MSLKLMSLASRLRGHLVAANTLRVNSHPARFLSVSRSFSAAEGAQDVTPSSDSPTSTSTSSTTSGSSESPVTFASLVRNSKLLQIGNPKGKVSFGSCFPRQTNPEQFFGLQTAFKILIINFLKIILELGKFNQITSVLVLLAIFLL